MATQKLPNGLEVKVPDELLTPLKGYNLINLDNHVRSHQTAIIVEGSKLSGVEYQERTQRLIESLNQTGKKESGDNGTIKADIFSSSDGFLYEGVVFDGETPGGFNFYKYNKTWGYTLVVVCKET